MNYQAHHDEWEEKIIARFAGDLDSSEVAALDDHLQSCPQCMQEMKEYALLAQCLRVTEKDETELQLPPTMLLLKQEIVQHRILEESQHIAEEAFRGHKASESNATSESIKQQEEDADQSISTTISSTQRSLAGRLPSTQPYNLANNGTQRQGIYAAIHVRRLSEEILLGCTALLLLGTIARILTNASITEDSWSNTLKTILVVEFSNIATWPLVVWMYVVALLIGVAIVLGQRFFLLSSLAKTSSSSNPTQDGPMFVSTVNYKQKIFSKQIERNLTLLRNSIYIMGTTVATTAIGSYFYWIVASHIYSAYDIGLVSALIAILTLASTLTSQGIGSTLIQTLPLCKTDYVWSLTLNAGLVMATLAGLLISTIMVVALPFLSPEFTILGHHATYVLVLIIGVPLWSTATLLDQAFVAERAARNMLMRNVAFEVLKLLLIVLPIPLIQLGASGILVSWILALAATLLGARLLLIPHLRQGYCLAVRGIVRQVRSMLSLLVWHHFINISSLMPIYLLPMIVAVRLSPVDNAYYYTTSMVSNLFFMMSSAVATSLFAEGSHTPDDVLRKARFSALIIGLLLGPTILAVILSGHFILLLFGPAYAKHGLLLLTLLTVAAVPGAITNIYVSVLRVQSRLRFAAVLNLSTALLTLLLAWILLPTLGIAGAGCAFLIAQMAGSLAVGVDLIRNYTSPY